MVMVYETYLLVKATQRLMKVSQHEKKIYKSEAYRRCGHGLTPSQFDGVVQGLVSEGWCSITEGTFGAELLNYNNQQEVQQC